MILIFKWGMPDNENEELWQIRRKFGKWKTVTNIRIWYGGWYRLTMQMSTALLHPIYNAEK